MIYLDYNATTPVDERVLDAMLPYFRRQFGNAASDAHPFGWAAAEAVKIAREQVAALIGASPEEIIFTSGATESLNLALKGITEAYSPKNHWLIPETEHKAVLDTAKTLARRGAAISLLPVMPDGLLPVSALAEALLPDTLGVCVMYANNETGVIQPIRALAEQAKARGALVVCDAVQAVGKIPIDVESDGIDVLALSGHKLYAPKGVGALYLRRRNPRVRAVAQLDGGGHERGFRSGTLNVPAIVGLGKAAEIAQQEMTAEARRLRALRDTLEQALAQIFPEIRINGATQQRLAHVSNLTFPENSFSLMGATTLAAALSRGVAVSSGSACSSASAAPSHVLLAMGLSPEEARRSVRFSLGRMTTDEEIQQAIAFLRK